MSDIRMAYFTTPWFVGIFSLWCLISTFASTSTASSSEHVSQDMEQKLISFSNSRSYFDHFSNLGKYKAALENLNKDHDGDAFLFTTGSHGYFLKMFSDVLNLVTQKLAIRSNSHDEDLRISELLSLLKEIEANKIVENVENSSCINDTGRLIINLLSGSSWAFQFFDAIGKPGPSITKGWLNFVGSYDQCREANAPPSSNTTVGFKGNYCTLSLALAVSPFPAQLGLCLPSSCSSRQVTQLFKDLFLLSNISSVSVDGAQCLTADTKVTTATVFAIIILCLLGSLAILGTCYDVVYVEDLIFSTPEPLEVKANGYESENQECGNYISERQEQNLIDEAQPLIPKMVVGNAKPNLAAKILLAFSLYSNGKKLLNTSQPTGSLSSIHGIRFLSMTWVVLGHVYSFGGTTFTKNFTTEIQSLLHRWTFDAIANALVSVDTFFTLSGLLTSYLTITELWKRGLRINWAKFYFHRFWRLTPPYMFVLVIYLGLQQYMGQGPLWGNEQPADKKFCEKYWWRNLLYINNLADPVELCMPHSWYLANDMQFFVISPIMLIPFYFHWLAGVASCTVVILVSWITTGVLSAYYGWDDSALSLMKNHMFDKYYEVPWCRIGPYVVGIMAGYVLAVTKGKPFKIRWWVVTFGWVVAIASALAVLYGLNGDLSGEHPSTRSVAALYNSVGRTVWGACVCWVIVACAAGYGGPVNALLSWSPFVMLGRLTYMTYLIHLNIILIFFGNMGGLYYGNDTTVPVLFMGLLVFSNMAAFLCVLIMESPMIGLEKVLLRKERKD